MYSVSSTFLSTLLTGNMISVSKVIGTEIGQLSFVDGSVTMDARRNITRTASVTFTATASNSLNEIFTYLMTPGIEITIYRGLNISGTEELVPLGVFSTDEATIDRATGGTISWSGSDRSKKISRAKFIDPYQITAGTSLATAGTALLQSRWSQVTTNFANVTETVTAQLVFEAGDNSDPWASARDLFADYGYDLNFDGLGTARAIPVGDPAQNSPIFDFGSGNTNLVISAESSGSFENVYNGVIASGEGSNVSTPIRAVVWDTNPSSPTYYLGGYGAVPLFYSSPLLTTTAICQAAATLLLALLKGRSETLKWPSIVNPALEPLDVVTLTIKGTPWLVVLDSLTIPLQAQEPMTANARQVVSL